MKEKKKFQLPDKFVVRLIMLVAGLFLIAFGVAMSTKSGLGVSPSAAIPFVLSNKFPISMGVLTTCLNLVMIIIQIVLLRKNYKPIQLLQLVIVFIFGYFTDLTIALVSKIEIDNYFVRLAFTILSCFVMGLGLFLEVKANLITMASEGAINAIKQVFHTDFGKTKIGLDLTLVIIGVGLSFIFFGKLIGVREGTIIAAILVGMTIRIYNKVFKFVDKWLSTGKQEVIIAGEQLNKGLVITIEREYASGGKEIGEKLSKELGIPVYDYQVIIQAAKEAGYKLETIAETEERMPHGLLYALYNQSFAASQNLSKQDAIFEAQSQIIRTFAGKESCIIIGRLGAFVLKDRPNTFNIFVSGDRNARAQSLVKSMGMPFDTALDLINKEDKARANYCTHFTGKPWGLARHYAVTVDSSLYGVDGCVGLIMNALDEFKKARERETKAQEA